MKKLLSVFLAVCLTALTLCSCSVSDNGIDVDSLEALKVAVPVGKEPAYSVISSLETRINNKGYRVEYIEYASAAQANAALAAGEADVSLICSKQEFDAYNAENPDVLLNLGAVYFIPYALFLLNFEEFETITDGATIALPDDETGLARALHLLEANGLIKLKEGSDLTVNLDGIAENSRNFEFVLQSEAELAENLTSYEADIAVMSARSCVDAGFALYHTARAIEDKSCLGAKTYSTLLLIAKESIGTQKHKTVSPLYFSPLMFDSVDSYKYDLIVPSFSNSAKK